MIKKISLLLVISTCVSFHSTRTKKLIPPGTVQITERFFADETEVSNLSWQEYEFWTVTKYGKNSKEHLAALPDTLVWRQKTAENEPYVKYYYRHPAYKNYPVVGISHQQAIEFCKWRTERVKEFYYIAHKKELKIEYRLPTKNEWEMISENGMNIFNNGGRNKKGEVMFNHCAIADSIDKKHGLAGNPLPDVIAPAYSYWPNRFGLFCTFGNVAEMVAEKGICKGGSWRNSIEECRAGKDISYTVPTAWLGLRCVCVFNPAS